MDSSTFLDSYRQAFDAFDADAIAAHYHFPSILASIDGTQAFLSREDAVARFTRVCDHHRRLGYHHASCDNVRSEELADNLWRLTVDWRFHSAAGNEILAFSCSYELGDYGDGPRVTAAIVHG
ncbi:MAG: hypothetical protein AAGE01_01165 [Pseudomonadota bacterium]